MTIFLFTLFIIVCVLLIIVVLLQKGRGGGLGAAFGGAGSSAFGTRTGDVFTWVTIVLTALFLLLAIATSMWTKPPQTKVATPMFLPADHAITEPVNVTIQNATRNAKIYYTVNGKTPDKDSKDVQEYDGSFRVTPNTTIKARAYYLDMIPSDVATAYYGPAASQPATEPTSAATTQASSEPATAPAGK